MYFIFHEIYKIKNMFEKLGICKEFPMCKLHVIREIQTPVSKIVKNVNKDTTFNILYKFKEAGWSTD